MKLSPKTKLIIVLILVAALVSFVLYSLFQKENSIYITREQPIDAKDIQSEEDPIISEATLAFAGDVMLGRLVGYRHQEENFAGLIENFDTGIFEAADIAWINLEGPISNTSVRQDLSANNLNFLFSRESLEALKSLGINVVGLANNHTFDRGSDSLKITQLLLEKSGIEWHGLPTKVDEESIYRFVEEDIRVSLIAVHTLYDGSELGINEVISLEKEKGFLVIVLPHWGNEYQTQHSVKQEEYVRAWADAGTDIIIGTHPHVVQDAQIVKRDDGTNTLVFYSLGNFIFDQTFSEETQLGLILEVNINSEKLVFIKLIPVESVDLKPQYPSIEKKERIINRVCQNIQSYCNPINGIVEIQL